MLKTIRVILAVLSILMTTLLFIDFTGTAQHMWPWMAKIQLMPALLSVNIIAIFILLAITLVFGRVYCSVICPLGILQDIANWMRGVAGKRKKRRNRFKFTKAHTKLRLIVLTIFVVLVVLGLTHALAASIAGLIEPYSAYGRIASQIIAPIYDSANNALATWSESRPDNYIFYQVSCFISIPIFAIAIITLIIVSVMAWRGGRDYCNTICPVGTMLGYLSKYSVLKPVINVDKCINCGKCGRNCKAKCIDTKSHTIDYTRCVDCMDCIVICSEGAIKYTVKSFDKTNVKNNNTDNGRRAFVGALGFLIGTTAVETFAKTTDGGLEPLKKRQKAERATRIVPAGAKGHVHLSQHCTACQLCVQACPKKILKPTLSIDGFMQPSIDYAEGYCPVECTVCSNICPAGAIEPIDESKKSAIKIGTAKVDLDTCISASESENCGNCARHCPAGAIMMIPVKADQPQGARMPVVNEEACIGCGACEFYCPAGTVASMSSDRSAIYVEGINKHREI